MIDYDIEMEGNSAIFFKIIAEEVTLFDGHIQARGYNGEGTRSDYAVRMKATIDNRDTGRFWSMSLKELLDILECGGADTYDLREAAGELGWRT